MKTTLYAVATEAEDVVDGVAMYSDYEMARNDAFMCSQMEDGETYKVFEVVVEIQFDTVKISE